MDVLLTPVVLVTDDFERLSDHFILRMYELIRNEVQADASTGTRLIGSAAKERADRLLAEIDRRSLFCKRIEWPESNDACKRPQREG